MQFYHFKATIWTSCVELCGNVWTKVHAFQSHVAIPVRALSLRVAWSWLLE